MLEQSLCCEVAVGSLLKLPTGLQVLIQMPFVYHWSRFFFFCLSNVFEWLLSGSIMSCGEISSSCLISSMLCDFPYICCFVQVCAAHDKTFLTFYYNEVISLSEFSSETRSTCMSVGTRSEYSWYLASSVVLKSRGHHQWNEGKNRKCKKTFLKMMTSWVWRKSFKV